MVLEYLDEQSKSIFIQWFVTPIRYFLKLVNEEKIVQILEQ